MSRARAIGLVVLVLVGLSALVWAQQPINVAQVNGVTVTMGNGASGTGVQRVTIANDSTGVLASVGTVTTLSQLGGTAVPVEDVGETAGGTGIYAMTVRRDTAASSAGTTGDNATLNTDSVGALWVNPFSQTPSSSTYLTVRLSDGSSFLSPGTDYTHDAALTVSSTAGPASIVLAKDFDGAALPNAVTAEGDAVLAAASLSGVQYVMVVTEDGAATGQLRIWDGTDTALVDGSGNLNVVCGNCSGSGAVHIDDAAFTATTDDVAPLGALYDTTPPTITDGRAGVVRMDSNRYLLTTVGAALPAGTNNIGDVDILSFPDNEPINVAQLGGAAVTVEDAAETAGGAGIYALSVRRDTAASSAGTAGDNATLNTDSVGALWTRTTDPCSGPKTFVAVNQTTGTQLFTGTASNRTYICHVNLVTATAQNIALVSGTGTVCATSTGPLMGGTTAATGWNFAANGGIAAGAGNGSIAKSDTDADNVCILQSGSGQISGVIAYVVAPN
jgi:hypothetical protein